MRDAARPEVRRSLGREDTVQDPEPAQMILGAFAILRDVSYRPSPLNTVWRPEPRPVERSLSGIIAPRKSPAEAGLKSDNAAGPPLRTDNVKVQPLVPG